MSKATLYIKEICEMNTPDKAMKITPIGDVTGVDGRVFKLDGAKMLSALKSNGLKLVLNVEHGYHEQYGGEAAGWFDGFELKNDGLYATLTLNALGKKLLEAQAYKSLSPEFYMDEFRNVVAVVGVGLVNQPNLLNQALNQQAPQAGQEPDGHAILKAELALLKEENSRTKQLLHLNRVDQAILQGKLLPAKKDFALSLDSNALSTFLEIEAKQKTILPDHHNLQPDAVDDNDLNHPVFQQLGIEKE